MLRLRSLLDSPAIALAPGVLLPVAVALQLMVPSPATAAPVPYTLQVGWTTEARLTLDRDRLTQLEVTLSAQTCTAGDGYGADDAWTISLPTRGGVPLRGRRIDFRGRAPSAYYPGGSALYTVSGRIAPDDHTVTGTIRLAGGWDPFVSGCSATYSFVAIPTPRRDPGWGSQIWRDFTSPFVSFDYRGGTVRGLAVEANFRCGDGLDPGSDSAELPAEAPLAPVIRATPTGRWSLSSYVLDEYGKIVRLEMTGRIGAASAGGRIEITEPSGLVDVGGESCRGDYRWSALRRVAPARRAGGAQPPRQV